MVYNTSIGRMFTSKKRVNTHPVPLLSRFPNLLVRPQCVAGSWFDLKIGTKKTGVLGKLKVKSHS